MENVADIAAEDEGVALEYEIAKEVCKTTYDYGMEFYKFNHKNEELHNARWSIDFFLILRIPTTWCMSLSGPSLPSPHSSPPPPKKRLYSVFILKIDIEQDLKDL